MAGVLPSPVAPVKPPERAGGRGGGPDSSFGSRGVLVPLPACSLSATTIACADGSGSKAMLDDEKQIVLQACYHILATAAALRPKASSNPGAQPENVDTGGQVTHLWLRNLSPFLPSLSAVNFLHVVSTDGDLPLT